MVISATMNKPNLIRSASEISRSTVNNHPPKEENAELDHSTNDNNNGRQPHSPSRSPRTLDGRPLSPTSFAFGRVIAGRDPLDFSCPCFDQATSPERQTLDRPHVNRNRETISPVKVMKKVPAKVETEYESDEDEDYEDLLPGGVSAGLAYQPTRILVEGWLHKLGTGKDWLGSTSWKPRWARLVMAKVDGYDVEVPLLMMYWYAASSVSTVIVLDSTVVFPVDLEDKTRWDAYRFDIRNAKTAAHNDDNNRSFTAPKKVRDTWVYVISQALLMYEKASAKARKAASFEEAKSPTSISRSKSPLADEVWTGDRFMTPQSPSGSLRFATPPSSPRPPHSSPKVPLPRPRTIASSGPTTFEKSVHGR